MAEKIKYKCLNCKFPFSLAKNRKKRCPNCGSESIEERKMDGKGAQRLINESNTW